MKNKDKESTNKEFVRRLTAGRPPKYNDKFADDLIEYFNVDPEFKEDGKRRGVRFPTLERFAVNIGVDIDTIANWANAKNEDGSRKYPKFFSAYRAAKAMQKDILVANSLAGHYASNFATFVAVNFTDMVDKSEIDATSKGEKISGFNYIVPKDNSDETSGDSSNPETDT